MASAHSSQIRLQHTSQHCCSTVTCTSLRCRISWHAATAASHCCQAVALQYSFKYSAVCLSSDCIPPQLLARISRQAQTSASSAHFCRASGIIPNMLTLATLSSSPMPVPRSGGPAVNVQVAIHTNAWQHQTAGLPVKGGRAMAVPSVQTRRCASTTPCTQRHPI